MAEEKDNQKVCAYLDLLGFRRYTSVEPAGAHRLLRDYQCILNLKVRDSRLDPSAEEALSIDSFEYFLPFSDSIFIVTSQSQADKFTRQLSHFLLECFTYSTSHLRSFSTNKEDPTKVTRPIIPLSGEGGVEKSCREEHWFPVLFRGGISCEEVSPIDLNAIVEKRWGKVKNLVSRGVVQAVKLEEELGKGPRIFCEPEFCESLSGDIQYLIAPHEDGKHYEILWPAIEYVETNPCCSELSNKFDLLLNDAVIFWNRFNHTEEGIHYYKFLKLIVRAALEFFDHRTDHIQEARRHISGVIDKAGLELKKTDLMDSRFI